MIGRGREAEAERSEKAQLVCVAEVAQRSIEGPQTSTLELRAKLRKIAVVRAAFDEVVACQIDATAAAAAAEETIGRLLQQDCQDEGSCKNRLSRTVRE